MDSAFFYQLAIPSVIAIGAAYLGFHLSGKRSIADIHRAAELEIWVWLTRLQFSSSHEESTRLHQESLGAIQAPLIKSMVLRGADSCAGIQRAMEEYCKVKPWQHREHVYHGIDCVINSQKSSALMPSFHDVLAGSLEKLRLEVADRRADELPGGRGFW